MPEPDDLLLPVPESVAFTYLVLTGRPPPADPLAALQDQNRWPLPYRAAVLKLLDHGIVYSCPIDSIPELPLDLFAATGTTPGQLDRVRRATHAVVVAADGPPGWPPLPDWAARAVAAAIAGDLDTDVIDLLDQRVLTVAQATTSLPDESGVIRLADWVVVAYSADTSGYWVTTNGLQHFGLPELQTLATPPNIVEQWGQAMTGIAAALLSRWAAALDRQRGAAFLTLAATFPVGRNDVACAYRRTDLPAPSSGRARVRLALDPGTDPDEHSFLTVHPPLDWSGSAGEHVAEVCAALFGARTSEIRHARRGELMDEAIATARAGLTGVRRRFEAGELGPHMKLLLKYALPADEGTEYLWAYVTSWRDP